MPAISESALNYLSHLNLAPEEPAYEFLERICHAHLHTFPFENISKLLYFRKNQPYSIPSFEQFINHYSTYQFGGTCYALNASLLRLLKQLGYNCYHVMLGNEHMAIIVLLDHERVYVDCGAAAPFFKPVRFEKDLQNISRFGRDEVFLRPVDNEKDAFTYSRFTNGKQNGKVWGFHSCKEAVLEDFQDVIKNANKPGAPFMSILRCQLYQTEKRRSVSLVNQTLSIRYWNGDAAVHTLASPKEIEAVIHEEFLLPKLPVLEAIDVLRTLHIDLFEKT